MWQKLLLLLPALLLTAAANVRFCCAASVCGQEADVLYSPEALERALRVSSMAAEEILEGEAVSPLSSIRLKPCIRRPLGTSAELTDALLRATAGVDVSYGVYVKNQRMGSVEDREQLEKELDEFITNQLPTWAVSGEVSEKLNFQRQYSRAGKTTDTADMVLLITGAAPVFYSDGNGYVNLA